MLSCTVNTTITTMTGEASILDIQTTAEALQSVPVIAFLLIYTSHERLLADLGVRHTMLPISISSTGASM